MVKRKGVSRETPPTYLYSAGDWAWIARYTDKVLRHWEQCPAVFMGFTDNAPYAITVTERDIYPWNYPCIACPAYAGFVLNRASVIGTWNPYLDLPLYTYAEYVPGKIRVFVREHAQSVPVIRMCQDRMAIKRDAVLHLNSCSRVNSRVPNTIGGVPKEGHLLLSCTRHTILFHDDSEVQESDLFAQCAVHKIEYTDLPLMRTMMAMGKTRMMVSTNLRWWEAVFLERYAVCTPPCGMRYE